MTGWLPRRLKQTPAKPETTDTDLTAVAGSLRFRFLLIAYIALLPVAALSIWQGFDRLARDQETVRQNLSQSASAAASDELNVFTTTEQMLRTLASESDVRSAGSACGSRVSEAVKGTIFISNIARISPEGDIACSALAAPNRVSLTDRPWWREVNARREFLISGPVFSTILGEPVLVAVMPLSRPDGAFDGTLNAAVNINWLEFVRRHKNVPAGAVVALFDKAGAIVASTNADVAKTVFAQGAAATRTRDGFLYAIGPDGRNWSFQMAPVIRRDYFVGFAMPSDDLFRVTYFHVGVDLFLPALMILLASLAIWFATDRLVIRWIELLQRMSAAYAHGHYSIRPAALDQAPREFRDLGDGLAIMAYAVQERDKSLRDAVAQKQVLIREIHHRVKNSLQIVMSLLSLQAVRLKDEAAREAVEQARTRINALALVHRMIYELDHEGSVDLKRLLGEVVEQLNQGFGADRRRVRMNVDAIEHTASADVAIPITLFAVEALTNAYKHAFGAMPTGGTIDVRLKRGEAGRLVLTVEDNGNGIDDAKGGADQSVGARLMMALSQQVMGTLTTRTGEGGGTIVELDFPEEPRVAAGASGAR